MKENSKRCINENEWHKNCRNVINNIGNTENTVFYRKEIDLFEVA